MFRLKNRFKPVRRGYTGPMNVQETVLPQARRLRVAPELSPEARRRLRWMDYYVTHGRNAARTCRHFDISRETFYRWWRRYDPYRLQSLEDDRRTRRPRRVRQPETPPTWWPSSGRRAKRTPAGGSASWRSCCAAMGGLSRSPPWGGPSRACGRGGRLHEPPVVVAQVKRQKGRRRPSARRKPWGYVPHQPGDLVQVDTTTITLYPAVRRVHFTARDMVSRKDVLAAYKVGTSTAAAHFLRAALPRMGFPIRALQIDGGSEFKAHFEAACQALGIQLFVLPPRSPKLNAQVERGHRTHQEEFYELVEVPEDLATHNALLRAHEETYNSIRPHQALGYLTPNEFVARYHR